MGHRTLKHVPLDFQWPIDKVWEGYINPYPPQECSACEGSGYNPETKQIADDFYNFNDTGREWCNDITQDEVQALVDKGRLMDFTHVPLNDEQREVVRKKMADGGNSWLPYNNGRIPTADEVNEWNRKPGLHGHDAINRWILIEARAKRLGVYGKCSHCDGEGVIFKSEEHRKLYEEWEEHEPPTGEGYQLWETCSEGSPVSPVFANAEELADWCAENATIFASEKTSRENWLQMFVGKEDLDTGSLMVMQSGYVGSLANAPKH